MKLTILFCMLLTANSIIASDTIVLVPTNGTDEALVIEQADITQSTTKGEDTELLEGDFSLRQEDVVVLNLEGRVSAFPMVVRGGVAAGIGFFSNRVEVGVDANSTMVLAGEDGELFGEVGVYAKIRMKKVGDTFYFRGRAFKVFNLDEQNGDGIEVGFGREFNDDSRTGGFVELTFQHITKEDGSTFVIPYISMGMRFGKPIVTRNVRYLD